MNTVENQTSTTEQHKQTKSKFSSNINHNEHQSRSMEQQIYHSHVWIFSSAFQVVHWATGTETLFDILEIISW